MTDEVPVALLAAAGLIIPPDELAELCAVYPDVRSQVERLYAPAFAEADPYLIPTTETENRT